MSTSRSKEQVLRPGRTVGLSLAILASGMLFTVLPLLQMALLLGIRYKFANTNLAVPGQPNDSLPIAVGGSLSGSDGVSLAAQAILGVVFLVIAIFAWRGRPKWIRFAMLAAVIVLTLVTVVLSAVPL